MTLYSFHIFDRRGKTLFTKQYNAHFHQKVSSQSEEEQRKLVFGMLFSLREIMGTLAPPNDGFSEPTVLQSVKTGRCTVHVYETMSGMRLVMYTDNFKQSDGNGNSAVRESLRYIYANIWVEYVVRSPLYRPGDLLAVGDKGEDLGSSNKRRFDIHSTEFEKRLDALVTKQKWYK